MLILSQYHIFESYKIHIYSVGNISLSRSFLYMRSWFLKIYALLLKISMFKFFLLASATIFTNLKILSVGLFRDLTVGDGDKKWKSRKEKRKSL